MTFEFRCAKTRVRPSELSLSRGEIHATLFVVSNVSQKHGPTLHLRMVFRHCFDRKTSRSGKRQGIHQVDGVFDDRSRPRMAQFSFQSYVGDNFTIGGATGVMDYPGYQSHADPTGGKSSTNAYTTWTPNHESMMSSHHILDDDLCTLVDAGGARLPST